MTQIRGICGGFVEVKESEEHRCVYLRSGTHGASVPVMEIAEALGLYTPEQHHEALENSWKIKGMALRAEVERLEGIVERVRKVQGSCRRRPFAFIETKAVVRDLEEALKPTPPFELPTEIPATIEARYKVASNPLRFRLFNDGRGETFWLNEDSLGRWTDEQIMADNMTDHRVVEDGEG